MQATELPLFPLSAVLLPYGRVPLQIFEQRYLDLVRDCMKNDSGFGVVWIRRGEEVIRPGQGRQQLGEIGTMARIIDWDQLSNGLLGITIEGGERFDLGATRVAANGLVLGEATIRERPAPAPVAEMWSSLQDILESLGEHPQVRRMGLAIDPDDAWQLGYGLAQLLPLDESLKYELLTLDNADQLLDQLDLMLSEISGEG